MSLLRARAKGLWSRSVVCGLLVTFAAAASALESAQPEAIVRATVDTIFGELNESDSNSQRFRQTIEGAVGPRLDPLGTARVALGPYWRTATDEQRARIAAGVRRLVLNGIVAALEGRPSAQVDYVATQRLSGPDDTVVRTRVHVSGGAPPISIDYRLQRRDDVWKLYDLVIEGISMLTTYRRSFTSRLRRVGLDAFIDELEKR